VALESAVYFCCMEAVQNATKHAGPNAHVWIRLNVVGPVLRFEVRDNGTGFDPDTAPMGMGLQNLRDRVDAFDGRLEVVSACGRGTVVTGAIPVPHSGRASRVGDRRGNGDRRGA
jgi:signal transduction histidine kinase